MNTSSLLGTTNYIGFYVDCLIQAVASVSNDIILEISASIYIGIYLYINAMVLDVKERVLSIDSDSTKEPLDQMQLLSNYVKEVIFHIEIIK